MADGVLLKRRFAQQLKANLSKSPGPYPYEQPTTWQSLVTEAKVAIVYCSTGCSAGSGSAPASTTGVVKIIDGSGSYDDYTLPGGGTLTITVYNTSTTALSAGIYQVKRESFSNKYIIDVASCA